MSRRILIVVSERHIARLVEVNLERAGHEVRVVHPSGDLQQAVAESRPQLIVVEPQAPPGVVQTLRGMPETEHVPVICLGSEHTEPF